MFWEKLEKPFVALAPMEDVTDTVFRQMVAKLGRPEVFFTEFINVDGLVVCGSGLQSRMLDSRKRGPAARARFVNPAPLIANKFLQRVVYTESERPIVAQIWGDKPENFLKAAEIVRNLGFDGIDINTGCPQRQIMKCGGGGALISDNVSVRVKVREIIQATKEGAKELPVSIKTRIGNKKIMTEDWIGFLLEQELAAITIHGRTVAEQSQVPAHWDEIGKAVELRDTMIGSDYGNKFRTLIIGNGDVMSRQEAEEKAKQYGVDGVMVGRGVLSNPAGLARETKDFGVQQRLAALKEHTLLYFETWEDNKPFAIMKKFVKAYINGFSGAGEMRIKLMGCESQEELLREIEKLSEA